MAQSSWPSPDTGRVVNDWQYERLGISFGPYSGLVGNTSLSNLVYADSTGMQVKIVSSRYAIVRGYEWYSGTSDFTVAISANASGSTRIDLVVLRLDRATWNVTVAVVAGAPGSGVPPAATQSTGPTTGVWELPIATVTVASGAVTISAANVGFISVYLNSDGSGYTAANTAAMAYIPGRYEGMRVYCVADSLWYRYNSAGAFVPEILFAVKAADEAVTNSITPQDDDHLFFALEANRTYIIECWLFHSVAGTIVDLSTRHTFPTGATAYDLGMGPDPAIGAGGTLAQTVWTAGISDTSSPTVTRTYGSTDGPLHVYLAVMIVMGGTAGNWRLQFAQASSNGTPVTVKVGSWARGMRVK